MYAFNHHTTIGGMDFTNIVSFSIQKSLDQVVDRAQLLMATSFNKRILNEHYDFFQPGLYFSTCLGYNGVIPLNFTGYLARRTVNEQNNIALEFWDLAYFFFHTRINETTYISDTVLTNEQKRNPVIIELLGRSVRNAPTGFGVDLANNPRHHGGLVEITGGTLKNLLLRWIEVVNAKWKGALSRNPITLNISDRVEDILIGDKQFPAISLLDGLNALKSQFFLNIYFRKNVVHVHPILSSEMGRTIASPTLETGITNKTIDFHFQRNIQTQGSLVFLEREQNPVEVSVYSYDTDGGISRETAGDRSGQTFYVNVPNGEAKEETAERFHRSLQYDGYNGNFRTFLLPYVTFGNNVRLIDDRFRGHRGTYLVKRTNTFIQGSTNYRQIFLSRRLDLREEQEEAPTET